MAGRGYAAMSQVQDAFVFPVVPPAVTSLGNVSGFDFYLQARSGQTHEQLLEARNTLLGMVAQSPLIGSARPSGLEDASQFNLDIDWRAAGAMGVSANEVGNMLSVAWAGLSLEERASGNQAPLLYALWRALGWAGLKTGFSFRSGC